MTSNANQEDSLRPCWTTNQSFLISHIPVYFIVKQTGVKWEQGQILTHVRDIVWFNTRLSELIKWEMYGRQENSYCNLGSKRVNTKRAIYYKRILTEFEDKDEIDAFHDHLNEQNADIQFTKEIEENGKLPFLTCLLSRDNKGLRTRVYRKLTHTEHS